MIKTVCITLVCLFRNSYVYKPFAARMESKSLSSSCSLKRSRQSIKNKNSKKIDDKGKVPVYPSTLHLHEKHTSFFLPPAIPLIDFSVPRYPLTASSFVVRFCCLALMDLKQRNRSAQIIIHSSS